MKIYWEALVSLFYPNNCENCNSPLVQNEELLCLHCLLQLPKTNYHLDQNNPLLVELIGRASITNAYAFLKFNKKGIAQKLLHKLKYKHAPEVGEVLGRWMGNNMAGSNRQFDLIIPIPIHISRQRKRGYNQSEKIANGLKEVLKVPVETHCLKRTKSYISQTKKGRVDRWLDAEQLYEVKNANKIKELNILLVDDVITTGATIASAVNLLIEHGAKSVSVACIATGK